MHPKSCFRPFISSKATIVDIIPSPSRCLTKELTSRFPDTFRRCYTDPQNESMKQLILTTPSTPTSNFLLDNENRELIVRKGDIIGSYNSMEGRRFSMRPTITTRYKIIEKLGQGTFGQVFKCQDLSNGELVALKVLKNKNAYFRQGLLELTTLTIINNVYDKNCEYIVEMKDHFLYCGHLCIVQELLGQNLYQMLKEVRLRGMKLSNIKKITQQILEGISILNTSGIVHCDLKPENVLLCENGAKIIDLGSACFSNYTLYSYIQSRHYRAPEIALGMKYSTAIDMWSVGCILAEMFLGIPLFPANSEYDLVLRFVQTLGMLPSSLLSTSAKSRCYFKKTTTTDENAQYRLKEQFEYEWENTCVLPPHKDYLPVKLLRDIIFKCQLRVENPMDLKTKEALFDFLSGCFQYDPKLRFTPKQALAHPFLTNSSLKDFKLPPREFCYVVHGHAVTAEPEEMIAETYKDPSVATLDLSRSQYYDVFMTLLKVGHVANVTIESPFTYGSITPPQLSFSFKKGMFDNIPTQRNESSLKESLIRQPKSPYGSRTHSRTSSDSLSPRELIIENKDKTSPTRRSNSTKDETDSKKTVFKTIEVNRHENARDEKTKKLALKDSRIGKEKRNETSPRTTTKSTISSENLVNIPVPLKKSSSQRQNTFAVVQPLATVSTNTVVVPKSPTSSTSKEEDKKSKRRFSWSENRPFNLPFFKKKNRKSDDLSDDQKTQPKK